MAHKRITKELRELRELLASNSKQSFDIEVDESNIFLWQVVLFPENPPYNKGAFRIEIEFPTDYPFKPPTITFRTKIYHPNIHQSGGMSYSFIRSEWSPASTIAKVIQWLLDLIAEMEPEHPVRYDLAAEYRKDRKKFMEKAEEFTKENSEKRTE